MIDLDNVGSDFQYEDPSEETRDLLAECERFEALTAKADLHFFVEMTWHLVEPDRPFKSNWHIKKLCRKLEAVSAGKIRRMIINVPPGTMKSLLVSVFWPAWEWASKPELRYLTASYGSNLTIRDNLRLRAIITSPWYTRHFSKVRLKGDQNAKERFDTTLGGWRIATSVGGIGTGEHPDRIIIDDPITAKQARSATERQAANDWFDTTISSRGVSRDVVVIIIMQRLHEEDLTGHLIAKNAAAWTHVRIPMRYIPARPPSEKDPAGYTPDPDDPRTEADELLWPELFNEEKTRLLEIDLGPYGTAGQLQQQPAPEGGGLFKREWFKFVSAAPVLARRVRGWDTAGTEDAGDYTAGCKMSEVDGSFYIEDCRRERLGPAGVDALIYDTAVADGKFECAIREQKEPASSGKTVIDARAKALKGFDYAGVTVSGDKVTMAKPYRAQCEAGNVYIVRTGDPLADSWIEPFIQEHTVFPTGKKDDQVDAASTAFNAVLLEPEPQREATWGR